MKYIKTTNLITGETKWKDSAEFLLDAIEFEASDLEESVKKYPQLGTVKDGSKGKGAETLRKLQKSFVKKDNWMEYYEDLYKRESNKLTEQADSTDDIPTKCLILGEKYAYDFCLYKINKIRKYGKEQTEC